MSENITDVDTFTDPIVVPSDGDAASAASVKTGFQGVSNRTRNHKNRLDGHDTDIAAAEGRLDALEDQPFFIGKIAGSNVAQGSLLTITSYHNEDGAYTLASNAIQVPSAGRYLVLVTAHAGNSSTSDPVDSRIKILRGAIWEAIAFATRWNATGGTPVFCTGMVMFKVVTPSTEKISLEADNLAANTMSIVDQPNVNQGNNLLTVIRLGDG